MRTLFIKSIHFLSFIGFVILLSGCEVKSPLQDLSDNEMAMKMSECEDMNDPAPAMYFACDNYQRECDRRKKELGSFVC